MVDFRFHLYITTVLFLSQIDALQIIGVNIPSVIQNGSRSSVVLDCEYWYEQYEVDGLEIKWFWNDEPEPVYQWIPSKKPEALGILKGRVNLRYKASKDRNSMHRAIEINEPTTELTGKFTCRVSSFHDEEVASGRMIVYAPAKSMNLTFEKTRRNSKSVTFTCEASEAFPEPTLKLILLNDNSKGKRVEPFHFEAFENSDGSFNVSIEATIKDKTLPKEALLQCLLEIPGTKYRIRRQVVYVPPDREYRGYDDGAPFHSASTVVLVITCLFLPSFLTELTIKIPVMWQL